MWPSKTVLLATASFLLLLAPFASAQDVTETDWQVSAEGPTQDASASTLDPGDSGSVFVRVCVTWGSPGLNPQEGSYSATAEITDQPSWLTLTPVADPLTFTPPSTATEDAECTDTEQEWELGATINDGAPAGEVGTISFTITIATDGDVGTFQQLDGTKDTEAQIGVASEVDDPLAGGGGGGDDDNETNGGDGGGTEESPLPAPLIPVLTLIGLAAWHRRRA